MSMPADAINAFMSGTAPAPKHLWTLRETAGTTFADEVSGGSGGFSLTAAGGCTPNAWTAVDGSSLLYGFRGNGGPQTAGALFDGTANGYAKATTSGPVLGGLAPGYGIVCWMDSVWASLANQVLYAEASPTSPEHLVFGFTTGGLNLKVASHDGNTTFGVTNPSSSANIIGGSASGNTGIKGGQFVGVSVAADGSVQFYRNGKFSSLAPAGSIGQVTWGSPPGGESFGAYVGMNPNLAVSTTALVNGTPGNAGTPPPAGTGANEAGSRFLAVQSTPTQLKNGCSILVNGVDTYAVQAVANNIVTLYTNLRVALTHGQNVQVIPNVGWKGTIGWVALFNYGFTADQFDGWYQALTPIPASGPPWQKAASGAVFPNSQLWNRPLDNNADLDTQSANIVSGWLNGTISKNAPVWWKPGTPHPVDGSGNQISNVSALSLNIAAPLPDIARAPASAGYSIRDNFGLSAVDQGDFLSTMPLPATVESQAPQPADSTSDSQSGGVSTTLGCDWATFQSFTIAPPRQSRSPMWPPYVQKIVGLNGQGTLPATTKAYTMSCVVSPDSGVTLYESAAVGSAVSTFTRLYGINVVVSGTNLLTQPGAYQVTYGVDARLPSGWSLVKVRVFCREVPANQKLSDWQMIGELTSGFSQGPGNVLVDDGTHLTSTPISGGAAVQVARLSGQTVVPLGVQAGAHDPSVQLLVAARFTDGSATASFVALEGTVQVLGNTAYVANGSVPVVGARVSGPHVQSATKIGAGPTQTTFSLVNASNSPRAAVGTTPTAITANTQIGSVASVITNITPALIAGATYAIASDPSKTVIPVSAQLLVDATGTQGTIYVAGKATAQTGSTAQTGIPVEILGVAVAIDGWTPPLGVWGQAGTAVMPDHACRGGGGSWDWYKNAANCPNFRPSGGYVNGDGASSSHAGAGYVLVEEALACKAQADAGWPRVAGTGANGPLLNPPIPHPLLLSLPKSGQAGGTFAGGNVAVYGRRWPNPRGSDGQAPAKAQWTSEGMRFRLPPSFDPTNSANYVVPLASDPITAAFQIGLMFCLRDYGAFDRDSGPGLCQIYTEDTPQSGRESWLRIQGGLVTGVAGSPSVTDPIPLDQFQLVQSRRFGTKVRTDGTFTANLTPGSAILQNVVDANGLVLTGVGEGLIVTGPGIQPRSVIMLAPPDSATGTVVLNYPAVTPTDGGGNTGRTFTVGRRSHSSDVLTPTNIGFENVVPY